MSSTPCVALARLNSVTMTSFVSYGLTPESMPGIFGRYVGGNGEQRPCYYLPKREAELTVMSEIFPKSGESLEVQQPSNSTISNTSNRFHPIGSPMGWANHIFTEKEVQHEGSTTEIICQASRGSSQGEAGSTSQDHASQDTGTSTTESRYSSSSSSSSTLGRSRSWRAQDSKHGSSTGTESQAIRPGQSHGGASSRRGETYQPVTPLPGIDALNFLQIYSDLAPTKGGTIMLTTAQKYIASRY